MISPGDRVPADPSMDAYLPLADKVVMTRLLDDRKNSLKRESDSDENHRSGLNVEGDSGYESLSITTSEEDLTQIAKRTSKIERWETDESIIKSMTTRDDRTAIEYLHDLNKPSSKVFDPTVFVTWDTRNLAIPHVIKHYILDPYTRWASSIARVPTDVVMITHLLLYLSTSLPSALYLFQHFTLLHGLLHTIMQIWYAGTYTLMMHQHIHQRGILARKYALIDKLFPYVLDPLHGHTWNTYFLHHVKHHHIEGNGPNDLSSTIRYQRDNVWHFLAYVGRFYFLIWLDLPLYFMRTRKFKLLALGLASEMGSYAFIYTCARLNFAAAMCVLIVPLMVMRLGLMTGNWGQHAFVDDEDPDSDFRSSITLLDVSSNRFCFNDGYHTSHHLNPMRHWRDHPVAFLEGRARYENEHALVFTNIDYLMLTIRLLMHDYEHIAKCMIPLGEQKKLTLQGRVALLKRKTRKFDQAEIEQKFGKTK